MAKLGLSYKKDVNFGEWYRQVLLRADMIGYTDISGCYIIRHWAMKIWENIKHFLKQKQMKWR